MSLSLDKKCRAAWNFCLKFVPKIKIWGISRLMKIQYLSCAICWTMSAKFFLFLYFLLLFVCCFIFHFYVLLIILVLFFRLSLFQCFLQEKTSQNEMFFVWKNLPWSISVISEPATVVIIFLNFLIFFKFFLSPQVKWSVIIFAKSGV